MRIYTKLLLFILLSFPGLSQACSCLLTSFCENTSEASAVAVVQIENVFSENGIEVRVEEKWSGKDLPETITVWGDLSGFTCGPYVSGYQTGTRLVLALYQLDEEVVANPPANIGDYFIPLCSNAILEIKNDQVEGYITGTENIERMSVRKLRKKLDDCSFPTVLFDATPEGLNIRLLFENNGDQPVNRKEIQILDLTGRLVREQSFDPNARDLSLETRDLTSGLYMIRIFLGDREKVFKGILGNS